MKAVKLSNKEFVPEPCRSDFIGTWFSVSDRLPEIPKDAPSYAQHVKVIACWGNNIENVAEMHYCRRILRGKEVYRFEWMGKISPWVVKYWMELPKPPIILDSL